MALGAAAIYFSGKTYVYRALYYNFAGIDDNRIFEERSIPANNPQPWPVSKKYNQVILPKAFLEKQEDLKMAAFLVVCHDSLRQEHYSEGYGPESLTNSFSVAKSVVSTTTVVEFVTSLRHGQVTFESSSATSFAYWRASGLRQ